MSTPRWRDASSGALLGICLVVVGVLVGCGQPHAATHTSRARTASAAPPATASGGVPSGPVLTVEVTQLTLTSDSHLVFSGAKFTPGATLNIQLEDTHAQTEMRLPPAQADPAGDLPMESAVMPANLAPGLH